MIAISAMHIPDGFLSVPIALLGWGLLIAAVAVALRQTNRYLGDRQLPLMGVLAAVVFAAQMINFPVAGGTSGHLIGGALVAILLGPWAAVLALTSVLAVQGLLFQDGGLLALGFNAFNMGVIAAFVGYAVYGWARRLLGDTPASRFAGAALGAWLSVVAAAAATALQLAVSGTVAFEIVVPAMLAVHALIGIGEALITVGALAFIRVARPDLIGAESGRAAAAGSGWVAAGLVVALAVALASPLADPNPDGLERVAEDYGFIEAAQEAPFTVIPDYVVPGIENEALATMAAGVIGVVVMAALSFGLARLIRRRTPESAAS